MNIYAHGGSKDFEAVYTERKTQRQRSHTTDQETFEYSQEHCKL